jgi:hypothetical protein
MLFCFAEQAKTAFNNPGAFAWCHYVVKQGEPKGFISVHMYKIILFPSCLLSRELYLLYIFFLLFYFCHSILSRIRFRLC